MPSALAQELLAQPSARQVQPLADTTHGSASSPVRLGDAEYNYILDSAFELGEITPMELATFRHQTAAAQQLWDALSSQVWGQQFLRNTSREYLGGLPRKEQYVWALRGLQGLEFALQTLIERMAFAVQQKVQADLGVAELTCFRWMDELASAKDDPQLFATVHDITPTTVLRFVEGKFGATAAMLRADLQMVHEALAWLAQPGGREEARKLSFRLLDRVDPLACEQLPSVRSVAKALHEQKRRRKQARGAIKKVLRLFTSLGREADVQMLVAGHEVVLSHPDSPFKFCVQPLQSEWLLPKTVAPGGHVPFQLSLLTKDDVFLSRLCVLFDATPVLDQLLALSLFVEAGNEMELLTKANWFGVADVQRTRAIVEEKAPSLLAKLPMPPEQIKEQMEEGSRRLQDSSVRHQQEVEEAHWAPYKAPVLQWLASWFSDITHTVQLLKGSAAARLA